MSFLPLILSTVQKLVDNPKSKYFLPAVLTALPGDNSQGKLLPIEQANYDIGAIKGVPGQTVTTAFENNWLTYLEKVEKVNLQGQIAIADPKTPFPSLNLEDPAKDLIQIIGLQNLKVAAVNVLSSTDTGYHATVTLQLNQWNKGNCDVDYPVFQVNTPYTMTQGICLADEGGTVCNGSEATVIDGGGTAQVLIQDAMLEVDVNASVSGQGASRLVQLTLNSLKLHGTSASQPPTLDIQQLTIGANVSSFLIGIWEQAAENAILSPDGTAGIFQQIDQALNSGDNLTAISSMINGQLQSILDSLFGSVASGALPTHTAAPGVNAVDQYLVDRASYALNTLGSDWYLPKVLSSISDPQLDPLSLSAISLPNISILGLEATDVTISQVRVVGISNAQTPPASMVFKPNSLSFLGILGALNPPPVFSGQSSQVPPPPTLLYGNFSLVISGTPVTGIIAITLIQPSLNVEINSEGAILNDLQLIVNALVISFSNLANLNINVSIESAFTPIINGALNTDAVKRQIVDAVNGALQGNLSVISSAITQEVKAIINSRLA